MNKNEEEINDLYEAISAIKDEKKDRDIIEKAYRKIYELIADEKFNFLRIFIEQFTYPPSSDLNYMSKMSVSSYSEWFVLSRALFAFLQCFQFDENHNKNSSFLSDEEKEEFATNWINEEFQKLIHDFFELTFKMNTSQPYSTSMMEALTYFCFFQVKFGIANEYFSYFFEKIIQVNQEEDSDFYQSKDNMKILYLNILEHLFNEEKIKLYNDEFISIISTQIYEKFAGLFNEEQKVTIYYHIFRAFYAAFRYIQYYVRSITDFEEIFPCLDKIFKQSESHEINELSIEFLINLCDNNYDIICQYAQFIIDVSFPYITGKKELNYDVFTLWSKIALTEANINDDNQRQHIILGIWPFFLQHAKRLFLERPDDDFLERKIHECIKSFCIAYPEEIFEEIKTDSEQSISLFNKKERVASFKILSSIVGSVIPIEMSGEILYKAMRQARNDLEGSDIQDQWPSLMHFIRKCIRCYPSLITDQITYDCLLKRLKEIYSTQETSKEAIKLATLLLQNEKYRATKMKKFQKFAEKSLLSNRDKNVDNLIELFNFLDLFVVIANNELRQPVLKHIQDPLYEEIDKRIDIAKKIQEEEQNKRKENEQIETENAEQKSQEGENNDSSIKEKGNEEQGDKNDNKSESSQKEIEKSEELSLKDNSKQSKRDSFSFSSTVVYKTPTKSQSMQFLNAQELNDEIPQSKTPKKPSQYMHLSPQIPRTRALTSIKHKRDKEIEDKKREEILKRNNNIEYVQTVFDKEKDQTNTEEEEIDEDNEQIEDVDAFDGLNQREIEEYRKIDHIRKLQQQEPFSFYLHTLVIAYTLPFDPRKDEGEESNINKERNVFFSKMIELIGLKAEWDEFSILEALAKIIEYTNEQHVNEILQYLIPLLDFCKLAIDTNEPNNIQYACELISQLTMNDCLDTRLLIDQYNLIKEKYENNMKAPWCFYLLGEIAFKIQENDPINEKQKEEIENIYNEMIEEVFNYPLYFNFDSKSDLAAAITYSLSLLSHFYDSINFTFYMKILKLFKKSDEEKIYDHDIIKYAIFFVSKAIHESNDQILATKGRKYLMNMIHSGTTSNDRELASECISLLKILS